MFRSRRMFPIFRHVSASRVSSSEPCHTVHGTPGDVHVEQACSRGCSVWSASAMGLCSAMAFAPPPGPRPFSCLGRPLIPLDTIDAK